MEEQDMEKPPLTAEAATTEGHTAASTPLVFERWVHVDDGNEAERRQHLPLPQRLISRLSPRLHEFFDPYEHGTFICHSRGRRKNRHMEFEPDMSYWKRFVVVPPLPRLLAFDYDSISWHVAVWFTLGSICWVVNGQYFMWPLSGDANAHKNVNITGYSALVGGMLFWVGASLAVLESLNETKPGDYGMEVRHMLHAISQQPRDVQRFVHAKLRSQLHLDIATPDRDCHRHAVCEMRSLEGVSSGKPKCDKSTKKWRWWGVEPSSIGWWASVIQFGGATCFSVAVISGTPGVLAASQWQLQTALVWTMQVLGSIGFVLSSTMLMLEEQRRWFLPAFERIGWHSAAWNFVGSMGFLLSAIFGYLADWQGQGVVCCQFWGTGFNTYYGSWAFLISSVLLLIEVQNKQPTSLKQYFDRIAAWVSGAVSSSHELLDDASFWKRVVKVEDGGV